MKGNVNRNRKATIIAVITIAITALVLAACSTESASIMSEDKQPESLVVETQTYRLSLPSDWATSVQYTVTEDDAVTVYYAEHSDLPILRIAYSNLPTIFGGDIANSLIYYKEAPDGRRLEIRVTNYPYLFRYDIVSVNGSGKNFSYLTDSQKIEIMKLETGEEINLAELYSINPEGENAASLLCFDYLKPLLEQGLTFL